MVVLLWGFPESQEWSSLFCISIFTQFEIKAMDSSTSVKAMNPQTNKYPSSLYWWCWEQQDYSKNRLPKDSWDWNTDTHNTKLWQLVHFHMLRFSAACIHLRAAVDPLLSAPGPCKAASGVCLWAVVTPLDPVRCTWKGFWSLRLSWAVAGPAHGVRNTGQQHSWKATPAPQGHHKWDPSLAL